MILPLSVLPASAATASRSLLWDIAFAPEDLVTRMKGVDIWGPESETEVLRAKLPSVENILLEFRRGLTFRRGVRNHARWHKPRDLGIPGKSIPSSRPAWET